MYTGNYYQSDEGMRLPRDYNGCAFNEEANATNEEAGTGADAGESVETVGSANFGGGLFESLASAFPLGRILPERVRSALHLEKFKIGTEELLIIALALFLFLSKDGDKECAIILFLLIFVN